MCAWAKYRRLDGLRLAELMIEFGVAVAAEATYTIKSLSRCKSL